VCADGDWSLSLDGADITGELNNYPFDLVVRAQKSDPDSLTIDELVLDNGANQIRAGGIVALADSGFSDLRLSAVLPELQKTSPSRAS